MALGSTGVANALESACKDWNRQSKIMLRSRYTLSSDPGLGLSWGCPKKDNSKTESPAASLQRCHGLEADVLSRLFEFVSRLQSWHCHEKYVSVAEVSTAVELGEDW